MRGWERGEDEEGTLKAARAEEERSRQASWGKLGLSVHGGFNHHRSIVSFSCQYILIPGLVLALLPTKAQLGCRFLPRSLRKPQAWRWSDWIEEKG